MKYLVTMFRDSRVSSQVQASTLGPLVENHRQRETFSLQVPDR